MGTFLFTCILYMLCCSSVANGQSFDPGCSFYNGQCVYNVKLGHAGQCDSVAPRAVANETGGTGSSSGFQSCSCKDIDALNQNINSLNNNMGTLQSNFDKLARALNVTQEQLGMKESQLTMLILEKQNLSASLAYHQMLLNNSKVDLANMVSTMSVEMDRLRRELLNTNDKLTTCQTQLNLLDSQQTKLPTLYGGFSTFFCGFEDSNNCNFTLDSCTQADVECWHQGTGRQDLNSGPVEDHTFGAPSGHYMYIDPTLKPPYQSSSSSSHQITPRKARMTSRVFLPSNEYCIRFWYTMHGQNCGDLKVYAQIGGGNGYPIFSRSGDKDSDWHMAEISLDSEYTSVPFKLVVEASTSSYFIYTGSSYHTNRDTAGYTAVDDIYVYNTSCSALPKCPAGARKLITGNDTSCYTFHITALSWYEAVKVCKSEAPNGHLVSVNSRKEQEFLVDTIQTDSAYSVAGQHGWYTSGNDERAEGNFVWTDTGRPYSLNYTNWHVGQPNNVGNVQNCLLLQYGQNGYDWGDIACTEKHPFICEIRM